MPIASVFKALTDASDWLGAQRDQWAARLDQLDEYLTRMDTT